MRGARILAVHFLQTNTSLKRRASASGNRAMQCHLLFDTPLLLLEERIVHDLPVEDDITLLEVPLEVFGDGEVERLIRFHVHDLRSSPTHAEDLGILLLDDRHWDIILAGHDRAPAAVVNEADGFNPDFTTAMLAGLADADAHNPAGMIVDHNIASLFDIRCLDEFKAHGEKGHHQQFISL